MANKFGKNFQKTYILSTVVFLNRLMVLESTDAKNSNLESTLEPLEIQVEMKCFSKMHSFFFNGYLDLKNK